MFLSPGLQEAFVKNRDFSDQGQDSMLTEISLSPISCPLNPERMGPGMSQLGTGGGGNPERTINRALSHRSGILGHSLQCCDRAESSPTPEAETLDTLAEACATDRVWNVHGAPECGGTRGDLLEEVVLVG